LLDHLSTQLLESYGRRLLEASELLALDDHLSTCPACCERWRQATTRVTSLLALQASLQGPCEAATTHLSSEQLTIYAAGGLDEIDRELAESHFEVCPQCEAQAQWLKAQAAQGAAAEINSASTISPSSPATLSRWLMVTSGLSSLWNRFRLLPLRLRVVGAAVLLALMVLTFALWLRAEKDGSIVVIPHSAPPLPTPHSPIIPPPEPSPILLALSDGGETITLDMQGNVAGLDSLPASDRQRVKASLETGKVKISKAIEQLRDPAASIMGSPSTTALLLRTPVGEIVASERPTFSWRPLVGAISYQIIISDPAASYQEVASSPQLKGSHWTMDRPLKRGHVYTWQIIVRTADEELKAPGPEAPAAKFKVLDHATASKLVNEKKRYAGRCLALGLLYAEAGLLDEAERELKALVAANPRSQIAKSLLLDLRSKHRRQ
jgi:anti-sigma factor RsiW